MSVWSGVMKTYNLKGRHGCLRGDLKDFLFIFQAADSSSFGCCLSSVHNIGFAVIFQKNYSWINGFFNKIVEPKWKRQSIHCKVLLDLEIECLLSPVGQDTFKMKVISLV